MISRSKSIPYLVAAFVLFSGTLNAKERPELDEQMKKAFNSLLNLEVLATSAEKFSNNEHRDIIKRDLETIAAIRHAFPKKKGEEPGMTAILSTFSEYVHDTQEKFQRGNVEYARHRVHTMGGFCLSCHSRVAAFGDFEDVESRVNSLRVSDFEKAEFYAATRQFDKGLASLKLYLQKAPANEMGIAEYTRALRDYVRLLVRVKQDPEATFQAIDSLSKRKDLPEFDLRMLAAWRKDAEYWRSDKVTAGDTTGEALLRKARALIERAETLHAFPADENGDISYLRATSYLHEALDRDPKASYRGEALYLLGIGYHSLQEPFLWDLDGMFFASCIREFPHSDISRKCYARYADKIYFGYTGSAGTFIPEEELKKLGELRKMSK